MKSFWRVRKDFLCSRVYLKTAISVQNAESDADRGDHYKSKERVIACLSTAKFLEPIEETLYCIPPFVRLFIKRPRLPCVHFRWDRIAGGLVMQVGSDFFCAIDFIGKNITTLQVWKQLQRGTASMQSSTFSADSKTDCVQQLLLSLAGRWDAEEDLRGLYSLKYWRRAESGFNVDQSIRAGRPWK